MRHVGSIVAQLDDWVLCRIYQKKQHHKKAGEGFHEEGSPPLCQSPTAAKTEEEHPEPPPPPPVVRFPRSCSLSHLLELEAAEYVPLSQMLASECWADGAGDNLHAAMAINFGGTSDCDTYGDPAAKFRGGGPATSSVLLDQPSFFRYY